MIRTLLTASWPPALVFAVNFLLVGLGWYPDGLDNLFHFAGGAAIAWFFAQLIPLFDDWLERPGHRVKALLAVGFAAMAAIFWELGELLIDPLVALTMQPSIGDTVIDLVLGVFGAVAYVTADSLRLSAARQWLTES